MLVSELVARMGLEIDEVAFTKGEAAIKALQSGLLTFAGAAVAGLALVGVAFAKSTANAGDAALKMAQSTGLQIDALQELVYAAGLADVEQGELARGLQHLARKGVKDIRGEMLKLADQFQAMPDDGAKVAKALDLFGRSGARLIPLLNGGREELAAMMEEAHEMGVVFSKESAVAAEKFNDNVRRLGSSLAGLRNKIGNVLIPFLDRAARAMTVWVKALGNLPLLLRANIQLLKGFAFVLGGVVLAALGANAAAIATTVSWYVALSVAAIRAAVSSAVAWLAAAAPFIAIVAAIAFVLGALEDLYQFLTGGESVIGDFVADITASFGGFEKFFTTMMEQITGISKETWAKATHNLEAEIVRWKNGITAFWKWLRGGDAQGATGDLSGGAGPGAAKGTGAALGLSAAFGALQAAKGLPFVGLPIQLGEKMLGGYFGGGASPAASASSVNASFNPPMASFQPVIHSVVNVHAQTTASPEDIAGHARAGTESALDSAMREAHAGMD